VNSTKRRPTAENRKLDPEELDFRSVPQDEIETCYIYEYARELTIRTSKLSNLFKQWLNGRKAGKGTRQFADGLKAYREFRNTMTTCFPDFPLINGEWFPDTPWQKLEKEVQQQLVKQVNSGPEHYWHSLPHHKISIEMHKFEKQVTNGEWKVYPEPFKEEDLAQTDRAFLRINWNYPDTQIISAFADWLSKERKEREQIGLSKIKYKPKGRGGCKDQLNWLAGLRVAKAYRKSELVDDNGYSLKSTVPRPYLNYAELCEGAKKARQVLSSLSFHIR
jgi:hypothetical protein